MSEYRIKFGRYTAFTGWNTDDDAGPMRFTDVDNEPVAEFAQKVLWVEDDGYVAFYDPTDVFSALLDVELPITLDGLTVGHSDDEGYKHIPVGGTEGQAIRAEGDGVGVWSNRLTLEDIDGPTTVHDDVTTLANIGMVRDSITSGGGPRFSGTAYGHIAGGSPPGLNLQGLRYRGTSETPATVQNNDAMLRVVAGGYDGTQLARAGAFAILVDGTPSAGNVRPRFIWSRNPDNDPSFGDSDVPLMVLDSTGLTVHGTLIADGLGIVDPGALPANLAAIAGLTSAADRLPYFTGSGTASLATFTSFARNLLDDGDASTARGTLGLGSMATQAASSVAITGGTLNGVNIGNTTPESGAFTTLNTTGEFRAGATSSGTHNANLRLRVADRFPSLSLHTANTQMAQLMGVADTGQWLFDIPAGINFRGTLNGSTVATITSGGDAEFRGGDLDVGISGTTRGIITAYHGSGGNTPGYIRLNSRNGTMWRLFVADDGTLRYHNAAPSANTDGTAVGGTGLTPGFASMFVESKTVTITAQNTFTHVTDFTVGQTDGTVASVSSSVITVASGGKYLVTLSGRVTGSSTQLLGVSVNDGDPTTSTGLFGSGEHRTVSTVISLSNGNTIRVKASNGINDDLDVTNCYLSLVRLSAS